MNKSIIAFFILFSGCMMSPKKENEGFHNRPFVIDEKNLVELKNRSAEGDYSSSYKIYEYYEYVLADYTIAEEWLNKAAEQGGLQAQYTYGLLLIQRLDNQSKRQGFVWLKKAAAAGFKSAIDVLDKSSKERLEAELGGPETGTGR